MILSPPWRHRARRHRRRFYQGGRKALRPPAEVVRRWPALRAAMGHAVTLGGARRHRLARAPCGRASAGGSAACVPTSRRLGKLPYRRSSSRTLQSQLWSGIQWPRSHPRRLIRDCCKVASRRLILSMDSSEEEYLRDCLGKGICPFCKQLLPEDGGLGTGQNRNGKFCGLTCYTKYYERELRERLGKDTSGKHSGE